LEPALGSRPGTGQGESETLAVRLQRLRVRAGLTQEALAERAGLSAETIGALEQGQRRHPYPHTLRALADALDLGLAERTALLEMVAPHARADRSGPLPAFSPRPASFELPAPPAALIGREKELAAINALLLGSSPKARLLTLVGPGGVGKTRLALGAAEALRNDLSDGVVWVDLSSLRDPDLVLPTLARAIGLNEGGATN
jgi:transcriptional regulator with XRE-family HTH domain